MQNKMTQANFNPVSSVYRGYDLDAKAGDTPLSSTAAPCIFIFVAEAELR